MLFKKKKGYIDLANCYHLLGLTHTKPLFPAVQFLRNCKFALIHTLKFKIYSNEEIVVFVQFDCRLTPHPPATKHTQFPDGNMHMFGK